MNDTVIFYDRTHAADSSFAMKAVKRDVEMCGYRLDWLKAVERSQYGPYTRYEIPVIRVVA